MARYDEATGIYYPDIEQRGIIDSVVGIVLPLACEVFSTNCPGDATPPPPPPEEEPFNWRPVITAFAVIVVISVTLIFVLKYIK